MDGNGFSTESLVLFSVGGLWVVLLITCLTWIGRFIFCSPGIFRNDTEHDTTPIISEKRAVHTSRTMKESIVKMPLVERTSNMKNQLIWETPKMI